MRRLFEDTIKLETWTQDLLVVNYFNGIPKHLYASVQGRRPFDET